MTYTLGRSAAAALLPVCMTMRMFWGMSVDEYTSLNASWICPFLGLLFYFPLAFAIGQIEKIGTGSTWDRLSGSKSKYYIIPIELLFALLLLYDAAVGVRLTASTSNIIALKDVTVHLLVLPLGIVTFLVVLLGGDAIGNSARIWLKILPLFAVILLLVQLKNYRFGWLSPVLGGGLSSVISGGIYCAGCMALLTLPWLIPVPDRNKHNFIRYGIFSAVAASLLLAAQGMSYPAMDDTAFTQAARIELILSNGRMSLSPQLLLDILWFGGLLYLTASEVICAACFLHRCFPQIKIWIVALAEALLVTLSAIFNINLLHMSAQIAQLNYVLIGGIFVLMMTVRLLRRNIGYEQT